MTNADERRPMPDRAGDSCGLQIMDVRVLANACQQRRHGRWLMTSRMILLFMSLRNIRVDLSKRCTTTNGLLLRLVRAMSVAQARATTTKATIWQLRVEVWTCISTGATHAIQVSSACRLRRRIDLFFESCPALALTYSFLTNSGCPSNPMFLRPAPRPKRTISVPREPSAPINERRIERQRPGGDLAWAVLGRPAAVGGPVPGASRGRRRDARAKPRNEACAVASDGKSASPEILPNPWPLRCCSF